MRESPKLEGKFNFDIILLSNLELAPVENSKSKYQSLSPVPNTVSATATLEMVEQGISSKY